MVEILWNQPHKMDAILNSDDENSRVRQARLCSAECVIGRRPFYANIKTWDYETGLRNNIYFKQWNQSYFVPPFAQRQTKKKVESVKLFAFLKTFIARGSTFFFCKHFLKTYLTYGAPGFCTKCWFPTDNASYSAAAEFEAFASYSAVECTYTLGCRGENFRGVCDTTRSMSHSGSKDNSDALTKQTNYTNRCEERMLSKAPP